MYASVRLYHLEGDMNEAMHRVDTIFAPRLAEEPGFIAYECIVTGDDTLCSVTTFGDEDGALRSNDLAAEFVGEHFSDMLLTRTDVREGHVAVSRAADEVLTPAHA